MSTWAPLRRRAWSTSSLSLFLALFLAIVAVTAILLALAALVYPGELTHLNPALNRWLYDRAADGYERKWTSAAYNDPGVDAEIADFARTAIGTSGVASVLDLGCGTGRGIRLLAPRLPDASEYLGIDYSEAMLAQFREWIDRQDDSVSARVELQRRDLADWAGDRGDERFGVVMMLEVGEFLPAFTAVLQRVARVVAPRGGLIMTRPAGLWWLFFPSRRQSRRSLSALLRSLGFHEPRYRSWRMRYELVYAVKR